MTKKENDNYASERILDKAEELFSQHGYHGVSVREITRAAHCNLAAVNYHIGNKKNLYLEVLQSRWAPRARSLHESFIKNIEGQGITSPGDILRTLVEAFIEGPLTDDERIRHHQLMARELAKPTGVLDFLTDQIQRPLFNDLIRLLKDYLPADEDDRTLTLKILSIFSLAMFFNFARPMVAHMTGCEYNQAFRNQLVEHITEFCMLGMGIKKESSQ